MDLTTLERVYKFDGMLPDNKDKEQIRMTITAVSALVQKWLGREIQCKEYTEYHDNPQYASPTYWVRAYPIRREPLIEIEGQEDPIENPLSFEDDGVRIPKEDMEISYNRGFIKPKNGVYVNHGYEKMKITYFGGMATTTQEFIVKYPDIEYEVAKQVVFEYKRRKMMTQESVGVTRNAIETYVPFVLQPSLKAVLRRYRRASFG